MEELGRIQVKFQSQRDVTLEQMGEVLPGFNKEKGKIICNRCGNQNVEEFAVGPCIICQKNCHYCLRCLNMGKVKECCVLVAIEEKTPAFSPHSVLLYYKHQMSKEQEKLSQELVKVTDKEHLVWAVTGAGKTEMIFELIKSVLEEGGRVGLAAPRIDVCNELAPRIKEAFPLEEVTVLHGLTDESYKRTSITIATTHQMLRFYHAFDVLMIDEVDAFPYVDNPVLYHAVNNCVKENGLRIFLTATSTDELDRKVKQGELKRLSLPRRFHGNPLIVPKPIWLSHFNRYLEKNGLPPKLKLYIEKQRKTAYPLLIFASEIKKGEKLKEILQEKFPNEKIGFVSSITEDRLEQVQAFRDGELTILVSTTILERGVTFPRVDVFVMEANHQLFTKSSLVQIGGRVGRSMDRPTGELIFFHDGPNLSIKKAIKEIKQMNQEAGV